eukprot:gene166-285_t
MGAAASIINDMSPEKQFELFKRVRQMYDEEFSLKPQGHHGLHGNNKNSEDFLLWKQKIEGMILDLSLCMSPRSAGPISPTSNDPFIESLRYKDCKDQLSIGDIVRAKDGDGWTPEGLIVEIIGGRQVQVDFGDVIMEYPIETCSLVLSGIEFELNDHVQVKPEGMSLYFSGIVIAIHDEEGTLDVQMDGDDPDDVEFNIPKDRVVKLRSARPLALGHWRMLKNALGAASFLRQNSNTMPIMSRENSNVSGIGGMLRQLSNIDMD